MMNTRQLSRPVIISNNPSAFLRDRIREDSNYELDWLWSAKQVSEIEEICYCLERALYVNPDNTETQRALRKLSPRRLVRGEAHQLEQLRPIQPSNS
jgi:hypothetical protein